MSPDEEFRRRRRRYAVMMGIRAACVLAATLTYQISIVLALAFVAGGVVLPWCAVVLANDRLVERHPAPRAGLPGPTSGTRALEPGPSERIIDL
jgi:predicted tellurium resistance membrane protein TerC